MLSYIFHKSKQVEVTICSITKPSWLSLSHADYTITKDEYIAGLGSCIYLLHCLADDNFTEKDYYIGKYLEDDVSDGIKGDFKGENVRDVCDGIEEDVKRDNVYVGNVSDGIEENIEEDNLRDVCDGIEEDVEVENVRDVSDDFKENVEGDNVRDVSNGI